MHVPPPLPPMERALAERLPHLRPPQRRGLALWVLGAVLAQSACQAAVVAALLPWAALPRTAAAATGMAAGRGGQGLAVRDAGRGRGLLRAAAAPGPGLVAGARPRTGGRR